MKRWNKQTREYEDNKKADKFIDDILRVFVKHDMSLAHEDTHGAFIITDLQNANIIWIKEAMIDRKADKPQKQAKQKEEKSEKTTKKGGFKFFRKKL